MSMSGDLSSLLVGDGAGDVRGEAMDSCLSRSSSVQEWVVGTVRTLAKLNLAVPLPRGEAALFNPNPNPSPNPRPPTPTLAPAPTPDLQPQP